jgi:hypothetical protein
MSPDHEIIAENFINELKEKDGYINYKDSSTFSNLGNTTILLVIRALREYGLVDEFKKETTEFRLTKDGWQFKGFEAQRQAIADKESLDNKLIKSSIKSNRASIINAITTIIFGILVTTTTLLTCKREANRDTRELQKLKQDSIKELRLSAHDSLYEKFLLRISQDAVDSAINARLNKVDSVNNN